MITKISGKIIKTNENSVIVEVGGFGYEVLIPRGIMKSVPVSPQVCEFVTFHYFQIDPSKSIPVLVGFLSEVEKEFFEKFITVSGIGPKAAVRALSEPISEIAAAIDSGDLKFLQSLPGIGKQRAKEIVAKLQGKVGKFGLIQRDKGPAAETADKNDIRQEAVSVLLQLEYKPQEAEQMVKRALDRNPGLKDSEELLNEVYRQKLKQS